MNVGLVTCSVTPRALANPCTNAVFPAPRSPASTMTSPGTTNAASSAARARVSSTDFVRARTVSFTREPGPLS